MGNYVRCVACSRQHRNEDVGRFRRVVVRRHTSSCPRISNCIGSAPTNCYRVSRVVWLAMLKVDMDPTVGRL
jgi:hypothetical protein